VRDSVKERSGLAYGITEFILRLPKEHLVLLRLLHFRKHYISVLEQSESRS
jgi:hypothetical protein